MLEYWMAKGDRPPSEPEWEEAGPMYELVDEELSPAEAASLIGSADTVVKRALSDGTLASRTEGRHVKISSSDLSAWLKGHEAA